MTNKAIELAEQVILHKRNRDDDCVQVAQALLDMPRWVSCDGWENLPDGKWLVQIDNPYDPLHTARMDKLNNVCVIAKHFAFDMPDVIAYMPLPPIEDK